uniref:Uncharacterized protein n=1 Tax=Triatoma infestans TaxID=30076 RepID=A0A170U8L8_TRIIF
MSDFRTKLHSVCKLARQNLIEFQKQMKTHFDLESKGRNFKSGDQVARLPLSGNSLRARYMGPFIVEKVSDVN